MRRAFLIEVSSLLLVPALLMMTGCGGKPEPPKPEPPRVTVAHPEVQTLMEREDVYNGWLEAYKSVEVRARVRGHITKVLFNDGDLVKEGQPLFNLDSAPFEAELKQVEAQAKSLEAQRVAAQRTVDRDKPLVKTQAVSQEEFDKAVADLASIEAQILAKAAEAERLRLDVKYAKIEAPLAGRISKAALTEGNLVNAGGSDPLLTTIVAIDPIYVDFYVDERSIQEYQKIGAREQNKEERKKPLREQDIPFSFGLDTEQDFPNTGKIVFADNKYTEGTGTILLRGRSDNPNGRLIPGSRVRVRIRLGNPTQALLVPEIAVLSDQDKKYLFVLGKDNVVKRCDIDGRGGLVGDKRVVRPPVGTDKVEFGPEDWLITQGLQRARLGYAVQPLDDKGQPVAGTGSKE